VALEARSWAALGDRESVVARASSGPGCQRNEGAAAGVEGAIQKGRRISHKDVTDARAVWAGRDGFVLRGRRGQWAG
jgi:hypothetical protein